MMSLQKTASPWALGYAMLETIRLVSNPRPLPANHGCRIQVLATRPTAALWGAIDSTCTAALLKASSAANTPHFFLSADAEATGGLNSSAFRMDVSPTSYGFAAAAFLTYLKRNCLLLITAEDVTDLTK